MVLLFSSLFLSKWLECLQFSNEVEWSPNAFLGSKSLSSGRRHSSRWQKWWLIKTEGKYLEGKCEGLCFRRCAVIFYSVKVLHIDEAWSWAGLGLKALEGIRQWWEVSKSSRRGKTWMECRLEREAWEVGHPKDRRVSRALQQKPGTTSMCPDAKELMYPSG